MEFSTIITIVDRDDEKERSDLDIVEATTGLLIGYHMHLQPTATPLEKRRGDRG